MQSSLILTPGKGKLCKSIVPVPHIPVAGTKMPPFRQNILPYQIISKLERGMVTITTNQ